MSSFVGGGGGGAGNSNRTELTQNTTYYIATTGSDVTGTGTIGNPWFSPQKAMDFIAEFVDTGGFNIIVQAEDGTYNLGATGLNIRSRVGGGSLTFQGNTGDKTKVVMVSTSSIPPSGSPIYTLDDEIGEVHIQFLQWKQDEANSFFLITNDANSAELILDSIDWGGGIGFVITVNGAFTRINGDIGILSVGGQQYFFRVDDNGSIFSNINSLTAAVPIDFSQAFANASDHGIIDLFIGSLSGTITGKQYICYLGGEVYSFGTDLTQIPGNAAGVVCDELSGIFWLPSTNLTNRSFAGTSLNQIRSPISDNGTTVIFGANNGMVQQYTVTGNRTFAFSGWPLSGFRASIDLQLINGGAFNITWPTINWITGDGDTSTNFSDLGVGLHIAGSNFIQIWSDDGGVTIYGLLKGSATFNFSSGQVPAAPSFPGIPHQIAWDVSGNMYICYQANTWAKYTNVFTPPAPSTDAQPLGMP